MCVVYGAYLYVSDAIIALCGYIIALQRYHIRIAVFTEKGAAA